MSNTTNTNSILLIADAPILNPSETIVYECLSVDYTVYLNTLLLSNWVEILSDLNENFTTTFFFNEMDKEFLPKYLLPSNIDIVFYKLNQLFEFTEHFFKNKSDATLKTLFLFHNSMGLNQGNIFRIFNLIQPDEPTIVIGKSEQDKIVSICTSEVNRKLINPIFKIGRIYSQYLNSISRAEIFIHTLDNFLSINDFQDIKKLYIELSKKESLAYCSPKMHESFNDLFIEYKELLNV